MRRRIAIVAPALGLLLSAPAAALADGAGDQQYQDPLTAPATPPKKKPAKKPAKTTTTPATSSPSSGSGTSGASQSGSPSTAPAASAVSGSRRLPRTGADARPIALAGALLLALGLALRRRTASG